MKINIEKSSINPKDIIHLKNKGMVGRIMYEILCFLEEGFNNITDMKLLEQNANEIIKIIASGNPNHYEEPGLE